MPAEDKICVVGIDHVQITIPIGSEDDARRFYCDLLGLREIPKPESLRDRGGFWLAAGNLTLHIGTEPEWDRNQTKAHVAFAVADLALWRNRITGAGCAVIEAVPIPDRDRFESTDPFGNRIEFITAAATR